MLVHVVTKKGKGYPPAEAADDKYHGVTAFDVITGAQSKPKTNAPAYTRVFADALVEEAARDAKIVAITAAMPSGTGLDKFGKAFPDRMFDVGIAEQHAVTFAAGLATEGCKPFCAIYSTFLQRAYDQVVHDVAIQNLPVRFAIDRAGLVGADGATHAGAFDIAYLACLPNMTVMAAADEAELVHMVATAAAHRFRPDRLPLSARRGRRRRPAGAGRVVADRQGQSGARRLADRNPVARHAARRSPEGGGRSRCARPFDHGRRRALRQAARSRTHSQAARDAQVLITSRKARSAASARMC